MIVVEEIEPAFAIDGPEQPLDIPGLGSLQSSQTAADAIDPSMEPNETGSEYGTVISLITSWWLIPNYGYCFDRTKSKSMSDKTSQACVDKRDIRPNYLSLGGPSHI